ncbi:hypothetical protein WJX73_002321 [Symbiochloris irregularis]|uniref:NF-kappa-B inhibitor-like protein 1 n=1 Tax=Symbiochloris irregularis TaxID=706552 RepID=A0AAW1P9E6_9CHLO
MALDKDPAVWTATEMRQCSSDWTYDLTDADVREVDNALQACRRRSDIQGITACDFNLPTLGPKLRSIGKEVVHGRGFQLIRGLPVDRYTAAECTLIFWGFGQYWGRVVPQNGKGHLIGHVRDIHTGKGLENPVNRLYTTNAAQPFHVDDADVVGLLCLHTAKSGGLSGWASSGGVYRRLLETHPEYVQVLSEDLWLDRKNEIPEGKKPYYTLPVFNHHEGRLCTFYASGYYQVCQRHAEVPRLTQQQHSAFAELERLAGSEELFMQYELQPGDIQLLHNHTILHLRTAYEDYLDEARKRHLLRMWITPPDGWPLPAQYAERYHSVDLETRGGIYCPEARAYVPATPLPDDPVRNSQKVIKYAALGKLDKLFRALDSPRLGVIPDVRAFDASGFTALHHAAQQGSDLAVAKLIRHGSDVRAEDFNGSQPAHLAAAAGHRDIVALLVRACPAILDSRNNQGLTVRQLLENLQKKQNAHIRAASPDSPGAWTEILRDGHDDFEEKLQEAAWAEGDDDDDDPFWSTSYAPTGDSRSAGPVEDEDTFARRMWEDMERRKRPSVSAATAEAWGATDATWQQAKRARQDREARAREESERILEEERRKDAAWRQAVLQGDIGARKASYEARWHTFINSQAPQIAMADVPWLLQDKDDARAIVLYGTSSPKEERKTIRTELLRWHPDRFSNKFGSRLLPSDKDAILQRVKHISQMLNSLAHKD